MDNNKSGKKDPVIKKKGIVIMEKIIKFSKYLKLIIF
tara:strand:- start:323 stop:433 length:111 start_codon:yes stop_codon:yes gene_type:complete